MSGVGYDPRVDSSDPLPAADTVMKVVSESCPEKGVGNILITHGIRIRLSVLPPPSILYINILVCRLTWVSDNYYINLMPTPQELINPQNLYLHF